MGKIIKLPYNGEIGYDASAAQVHEFYKIVQSVDDWLKTEDENGKSNKQKIVEAYDNRTKERLGFLELKDNEWTATDKSFDDVSKSYPIPWPIVLHVESEQIQRDILSSQSNLLIVDNAAYNFGVRKSGQNGGQDDGENFSFTAQLGRQFSNLSSKLGFLDANGWALYEEKVKTSQVTGDFISGSVHKSHQKLRVWVWCKALANLRTEGIDSTNTNEQFNKNCVIDLTPFIQNLSINQTEQAGSFSLTLPPIVGYLPCSVSGEPNGIWDIDRNSFLRFVENEIVNFVFKSPINYSMPKEIAEQWYASNRNYEAPSPTFGQRAQSTEFDDRVSLRDEWGGTDFSKTQYNPSWWFRQDFFFHNVISENDIVFIGGEDPFNSNSLLKNNSDDFIRSVDDIVNLHNVQIALVDTNSISHSAENTDVSIQIAGRDLMKLLIEDGSFFFQKSYANPDQQQTAFNNVDLPRRGDDVNAFNKVVEQKNRGVNRLITTGLIESLYNVDARNVGFVLNLLISRLSNIEICQTKVFESYGDLRTKYQVETEEPVQEQDGKGSINANEGE